jgi:hypothetical protein
MLPNPDRFYPYKGHEIRVQIIWHDPIKANVEVFRTGKNETLFSTTSLDKAMRWIDERASMSRQELITAIENSIRSIEAMEEIDDPRHGRGLRILSNTLDRLRKEQADDSH